MSDTRDAFEREAEQVGFDVRRDGDDYFHGDTKMAWDLWQAARAARTPKSEWRKRVSRWADFLDSLKNAPISKAQRQTAAGIKGQIEGYLKYGASCDYSDRAQGDAEPVYQWREIGETDWMDCSREWKEKCGGSPEHDTRTLYTQPQPAQQGSVPHGKEREALADEYVEGYEFRGDEGDYQPNDRERFLIEDCVAGLMDEVHQMLKRTAPQPAVPEGWRLVPVEPTEAMMRDAAGNLCGQFGVEFVRPKERFARAVYREMLRFSPQPPQEGE